MTACVRTLASEDRPSWTVLLRDCLAFWAPSRRSSNMCAHDGPPRTGLARGGRSRQIPGDLRPRVLGPLLHRHRVPARIAGCREKTPPGSPPYTRWRGFDAR